LPARYETINEPLNSAKLIAGGSGISGSTLFPQDTVIYVNDVSFWPSNGYLRIADGANFEICEYTSIGAYNPTIQATAVNIVRRVAQPLVYGGVSMNLFGTASQVNFVPDSTIPGGSGVAQVSVQTISQNCAPVMSHWGSSVIMDGGFNDDKSFIFTAGMQRYIQVGGSGTISATLIQRQASAGVATITTSGTHSLAAGTPVTITGVNDIATVSYKQLTNNIAYLNTSTPHYYTVGQSVTITGVDTIFNGTYTVALVPSATQIAFNKTNANIGFQAVSGAAQITASSRYNGTYTITTVGGTTFTFPLSGSDEGISSINPNGTAVQTFGTTPTPRPLVSIRVAPSVDNGLARNFGMRELANRMQMKLDSVGVLSQGQFLIEGILNPATMNGITIPTEWESVRVGSGSLAQVIYHDGTGVRGTGAPVTSPTNTVTGGDRIFAFYTENAGGTNYSVTHFDAKKVRDLANCILNGNGSQANPSFPNGPDILTVTATNLGSGAANILCRISWTEAQA
jgi:DNA/RNA endonuclease YhcR with UshA esterase domain